MPPKKGKKKGSKGSRKTSGSSQQSQHSLTSEQQSVLSDRVFGDWDPRLTNCQHYMTYHRGEESCQDPQFNADDVADIFHKMHLTLFHRDTDHPGFCSADIEGDQELHKQLMDGEDLEEEQVFEQSFELPEVQRNPHTQRRHKVILNLLKLSKNEEVSKLFLLVSALTDPMSQPNETDKHMISLELLSQLIIAFQYNTKSLTPEFDLAMNLFIIVQSTLKLLNCDDIVKLRSFNNSDLRVDWRLKLPEWTPQGINNQDLRLIYMIDCVCMYTIYKLYAFHDKDLCLNPFLEFFLTLWKVFTNIVLLGLEVDRRVETIRNVECPNVVKQVIRGSSAVRYVLASILNDDVENRMHDFNHLNIQFFLSAYGRRCGSGALYADVRWYVGAMLALGSELNEVVETLVDLEPNDRYDEDVKYIFAYEYEDFHHESMFPENHTDTTTIMYVDQEGNFHRAVRQRCTCQFFDSDDEDEGDEFINDEDAFDTIPHAARSDQAIEFDEIGRDWRDVTRGGNIFFNTEFPFDDTGVCSKWSELCNIFKEMEIVGIPDDLAKLGIKTIARTVKLELEEEINKTVADDDTRDDSDDELITTDKIYEYWSAGFTFEAMIGLNPESCYSMLDEMFMANGYRRVLIWFITHLALSFSLMNYIFELVNGLRGETRINKKFKFSRQGPLVLSEVEKSMLLHEFFSNCLIYLSKTTDKYKASQGGNSANAGNVTELERCIKIVKLICLMVNRLDENESIDLEEYRIEITSLLINWIGIIHEAKELFFKLNNHNELPTNNVMRSMLEPEDASIGPAPKNQVQNPIRHQIQTQQMSQPTMRHRKFLPELKESLSNVIKKLDNGALLFRPFFELIDGSTSNGATKGDASIVSDNQIPQGFDEGKPVYIAGEMKPLEFDEYFEHLLAEEALVE